jgi:hypothetical protein
LIQWTTDQSSDSQIEYGPTSLYGLATVLDTAPRTDHSQLIPNLTPLTSYHYRVRSENAFGAAFSGDFTLNAPDLSGCHVTDDPLAITELTSVYSGDFVDGDPTSGRLLISWLTRELADSQVEWGLTPFVGGAGGLTTIDPVPDTSHTRSIGPLVAGQVYFYRVRSRVVDPKSMAYTVYCASGTAQTIIAVPGLQALQSSVQSLSQTVAGLSSTVGPQGPQGVPGPAAGAVPGSLLLLQQGQSAPAGYTLIGQALFPVQTPRGYTILAVVLWRKDLP